MTPPTNTDDRRITQTDERRPFVAGLTGWRRKRTFCLLRAALAVAAVGFSSFLPAAEPQPPPSPPVDAAQRLFASLGVDQTWFDRLHDNSSITEPEIDVLLRMLYRLRRFPGSDSQRWANDAKELPAVEQDPPAHRGQLYRLRGRVTSIEPAKPLAEMAQRYEMSQYFRCRMVLDGATPLRAELFVEKIPAALRELTSGARGGAVAAFAKMGKDEKGENFLTFVAPRLAWYPETPLGDLGMDVGLLDNVQDQKLVLATESEAFYQLLAAVGRAQPGQLLREADEQLSSLPAAWRWTPSQDEVQYSVVPLFNEPASQRGRLVALSGTVRRIEKVAVENPEMQRQADLTHYYQVALFTDDSSGNPLTFCLRELPPGMPYSTSPGYAERVRIAGFFFKTWSYRVPKLADPRLSPGDPKTNRFLSPLLIGRSLVWHQAIPPVESRTWSVFVAVFCFFFMLVIWAMAWFARRRRRELLDNLTYTPRNLDKEVVLEPNAAPDRTIPDFDRIARLDRGPEGPGD